MRNTAKDRLLPGGLALAVLPIVVCSVPWIHETLEEALGSCPWAHLTLEAVLNLLWLLLAVTAFARWVSPKSGRRRAHLPGLVGLIFILALLFPVISADDDLAEWQLINDAKTAQSVSADSKSGKQLPRPAGSPGWVAALAPQPAFSLALTAESVSATILVTSVATPGGATGNHSPPLG